MLVDFPRPPSETENCQARRMRAVARPCQNTIQHVELAAVTLIQYSPDHRDGTCKKNRKKEGINTKGKSKGSNEHSHIHLRTRYTTRGGHRKGMS